MLQTFLHFFKKPPPKSRKLVIIATTSSKTLLDRLGLSRHFRTQLHVPNVASLEDFRTILLSTSTLSERVKQLILDNVKHSLATGTQFSIPVQALRDLLEFAGQEEEEQHSIQSFSDEFGSYLIPKDSSLSIMNGNDHTFTFD